MIGAGAGRGGVEAQGRAGEKGNKEEGGRLRIWKAGRAMENAERGVGTVVPRFHRNSQWSVNQRSGDSNRGKNALLPQLRASICAIYRQCTDVYKYLFTAGSSVFAGAQESTQQRKA